MQLATLAVTSAWLAASPLGEFSVSRHTSESVGYVVLSSVPTDQQIMVNASAAFVARFGLVMGAWNSFALGNDAYIRGGYLGVRLTPILTPTVNFRIGLRGIIDEPWDGIARAPVGPRIVEGGISLFADAEVRILGALEVVPDFGVTWLPSQTSIRLVTQVRFNFLRGFRLDLHGGAQVWIVKDAVIVAPGGGLSLGYFWDLGTVSLSIQGTAALARDASYLTQLPSRSKPGDMFGFVGQVAIGVVINAKRR